MTAGDFGSDDQIRHALVLYASLEDNPERRKNVRKNISDRFPFAFVRSIDGRKWGDSEIDAKLSVEMQDMRRKLAGSQLNWLAGGAIACAITHRDSLLGAINATGKILCEDDAEFTPEFMDEIQRGECARILERLAGPTLLYYSGFQEVKAYRKPAGTFGNFSVHRIVPYEVGSTVSYYMPAEHVPKLRKIQTPVCFPADAWGKMVEAGAFENVYIVHPMPVRTGDYPTTINYRSTPQNIVIQQLSRFKLLRRLKYRLTGTMINRVTQWID
jgi:hypothetical protein